MRIGEKMLVRKAKEIARAWVDAASTTIQGFQGAFFHGSINWLPDEATLLETSDVDVMIVLDDTRVPDKPGKFLYRGVLLEATFIASQELRSPEQVLARSDLAGSFAAPSVISDPTGQLTRLQAAVASDYAKRRWVRARCEHAEAKILNNLHALHDAAQFHDQVTHWLFATGLTTHMPLAAGLQNTTVRKRYADILRLLDEYDRSNFYEALLTLLGCEHMSREQVERHLAAMAEAFDAASEVIKTPFFFAADISRIGRTVAIDGSWELIERGEHREAVFWIAATSARCQKVLFFDAPDAIRLRHEPGFRALLDDLGIASTADLFRRGDDIRAFLPRVWEVAEQIIAANPRIEP
jgi:hypothetical protein